MTATIAAVHSYRGGAGKTVVAVNLALALARAGARVGLVDVNFVNPGVVASFGPFSSRSTASLADYLLGRSTIEAAAYSPDLGAAHATLRLVQSRSTLASTREILGRGYDIGLLAEAISTLTAMSNLDVVVLDTQAGVNKESLAAMACADLLLIVSRPDAFDALAAREEAAVARTYGPAERLLVINAVDDVSMPEQRLEYLRTSYGCDVAAVLPRSLEVEVGGGQLPISLTAPDHRVAMAVRLLAERLLGARTPVPGVNRRVTA